MYCVKEEDENTFFERVQHWHRWMHLRIAMLVGSILWG